MTNKIMDYLQNKRTEMNGFDHRTMILLDEIKDEYCTIFCGKDSELNGSQLTLNHHGIELLTNYFNFKVGIHTVTIKNNMLSIGCRSFNIDFIKELIILYKDGVRTDNDTYSVRVKDIKILYKTHEHGIIITEKGFICESREVAIETVEKWLK